jgi:putative ATP-dependent endonuclease of OLD family
MRISHVVVQNFRCFGKPRTKIPLRDLTAFIGANGCGKTAVLQALNRLFGILRTDRTLLPEDFHLPKGTSREDLKHDEELSLVIEAFFEFPELAGDATKGGVADCFTQMMVTEAGADPFCRVRLEATWTKGNLPEGQITERLVWVRSADDEPKDEHKSKVQAHDRSLVHVHYIPAIRDPAQQIRFAAGTVIKRLFHALNWSDDVEDDIAKASNDVQQVFAKEKGVQAVEAAINSAWQTLHSGDVYAEVILRPVGRTLEELLRQMQATFTPAPGGEQHELERLSDGLKSLFYLSMVSAGFQIESGFVNGDNDIKKLFDADELAPPALTVFAIEEPENHIAPHYLGRILSTFRALIETKRAQVLLTSHSPSVLQRVEPREVRYLRLDSEEATTSFKRIHLPKKTSDEYKYVREAVRAYPELYFSRLVVLGEGDTEEVVLPRIAAARGVPLDSSFVSVVPLGGRHVNHFWRLLHDLDIPHITLLDLDRERQGGGWGRIHYAFSQLLEVGTDRDELLKHERDGKEYVLSEKDFDEMPQGDASKKLWMQKWIDRLAEYDVYFSAPLDLDFLMLRAFPDEYKAAKDGGNGPKLPDRKDKKKDEAAREAVIRSVLKAEGGDASTYEDDEVDDFFWYRYLFLGRGKPTTHLLAMAEIAEKELAEDSPEVIATICDRMKELLKAAAKDEADAT